ncbi:hypothetical protein VTH06DRAFT_882 [Thermothelomyces fergusii]
MLDATGTGQRLSEIQTILDDLRQLAKFKARSHETSKNLYLPLLQLQSNFDNRGTRRWPVVVLLGDSMLERMTTTGGCSNLLDPWPSHTMLDDDKLRSLSLKLREGKGDINNGDMRKGPMWNLERLQGIFNAGVGGDMIQNLVYRLVGSGNGRGDRDGDREDLPGLLPALAAAGTVRIWVLHVGTNNLSPKKGLSDRDVDALRRVTTALSKVHPERGKCRVLVTGLFYRKDVSRELVDGANEKIQGMVKGLQDECGSERVTYLPPTAAVNSGDHLEDHVHLTLQGYQLWIETLFPSIANCLQ